MSRLFVGNALSQAYSRFRPVYPSDVIKCIIEYCRVDETFKFQRAVDVGCGSGQSTFPLLTYFKDVTGLDPSNTQINEANKLQEKLQQNCAPNKISFVTCAAENMSIIQASSTNLLTIAQAMHWVDEKKFYEEAKRTLVVGGVLAVYGYGNVKLDNNRASEIVTKFYKETVGPYWEPERKHVDNTYKSFVLPFVQKTRIDSIVMKQSMSLENFVGYISSWSAYWTYKKNHPHSDILSELYERLTDVYACEKTGQEQTAITVTAEWPVFVLIGRNK